MAPADFAVWDVQSLDELQSWMGRNFRAVVVRGGEIVRGALG
jgi:imidazolonepropionase